MKAVYERLQSSKEQTPTEAFARWRDWALKQADRIDPVKSGRFLHDVEDVDTSSDTV